MNAGYDYQGSQHGILTASGSGNAVLMPKSDDNSVGHGELAFRTVFVAIAMQRATLKRAPIGFDFYEYVCVR